MFVVPWIAAAMGWAALAWLGVEVCKGAARRLNAPDGLVVRLPALAPVLGLGATACFIAARDPFAKSSGWALAWDATHRPILLLAAGFAIVGTIIAWAATAPRQGPVPASVALACYLVLGAVQSATTVLLIFEPS